MLHASLRVGLIAASLLLLSGCAPSSTPGTPATPALPGTLATPPAAAASPSPAASPAVAAAVASTVQMTDALTFEPATMTIPRGTSVTWRNTSQVAHTVTDDPSKAAISADAVLPAGTQPWDSGSIDPTGTYSHTFDVPGTYRYFCQPHEAAGMVGTLVVTP